MSLLLIIFFLFICSSSQEPPNPERNTGIRGTVELPSVESNTSNRFRGRAYRNRNSNQESETETSNAKKGLTSVIVSAHPLSGNPRTQPLPDPVQIIQKDAIFIPHVTPVTVGSVVQFVNDDPFFHNVFSLTPGAKFNIGRRPKGDIYSKTIPQLTWKVQGLGPISLYCDIHSQMNAIILSLDTPYFTRVNEDGTYSLPDLPAGEYEIRAYHPRFDLEMRTVTISEGDTIELSFSFS